LDVSDEEHRDAAKTEVLICKKMHEIMDLQGDIDALLLEKHPTLFGSARWKKSRPETLQRLFHNLRASCETDLAREYPIATVASGSPTCILSSLTSYCAA
jgi:hypothetical protein